MSGNENLALSESTLWQRRIRDLIAGRKDQAIPISSKEMRWGMTTALRAVRKLGITWHWTRYRCTVAVISRPLGEEEMDALKRVAKQLIHEDSEALRVIDELIRTFEPPKEEA